MPVFPVVAMQRFDFKNSNIAIKLYLMFLNLYLPQNDLKVKRGVKVWFCGGCALKWNYIIEVMKDLKVWQKSVLSSTVRLNLLLYMFEND